jgi:hypothetical protein
MVRMMSNLSIDTDSQHRLLPSGAPVARRSSSR